MGIAISLVPKVLQPVLPEIVEAQVEQGFIGLIPSILRNKNVIDLAAGSFQLDDLHEIFAVQDRLKTKNIYNL